MKTAPRSSHSSAYKRCRNHAIREWTSFRRGSCREKGPKLQRFLSQPFHVAEVFTGIPGKFVPIEDTVRSFKAVVAGEYDHLPEGAFYMVGGIEEAVAKAEKLAQEA